jgi:hypothetical protein
MEALQRETTINNPDQPKLIIMNRKLFFNKNLVRNFVFLVSFLLLSSSAMASHFRYGDISWRIDNNDPSGRTIIFKANTGWRVSPSVSLRYSGTSRGNIGSVPQNLTGSANGANYYSGEKSYTFPANGTYKVFYQNCCKIGDLSNNANGYWYVYTTVTVGNGNNSPVTSLPAIVNVQVGTNSTFNIPAADPDGDAVTYRLASSSDRWRGSHPQGLSVSSNGQVSWNTNGTSVGQLWNTAVVITDSKGAEILVDFIIKITQQSNPPQFDYAVTPLDGASYQGSPGQAISFQIKAFDTDPNSKVTLSASGLPIGSSTFPNFGFTANPINHIFSWTPNSKQFGQYLINFIAQDNNGVQTSSSVSINISLKPRFDVPPTPATGVHNTVVSPGTLIQYTVQASDPDAKDVVKIVAIEGKDMMGNKIPIYIGASLSSLPTKASNPTSGIFSWTPTKAQWGHRHVYFTARDSYGDEKVHEVYQLVNTPPVFASSPVLNADVGVTYRYTVQVTDSDITYGDQLTLFGNSLPAWLSVKDNGDGTATLTGTPTAANVGVNYINIQADDKHHHEDPRGSVIQTFDITVNNCQVNTPTLADVTGQCDATATVPTTTDNCAGTIKGTTSDPLTYAAQGTHVITWSFDDGNGNIITANQNVIVNDTTDPNTPTLADVTGQCDATATVPTTRDNCAGSITGTTSDPLTYAAQGTHVITWSFDDGNGNVITANQNVIVNDITDPNTPTLADVTGQCDATATVPTTRDNCAGSITGTTSDPLTYARQGTHVITWSFDDGNGNVITANQNVIVNDITDPNTPTLADVTGQCDATATVPATTDNCAGSITGTTPDPLTYARQGTHVITWTFDDGNGNVITANQNVIVNDTTDPNTPTLADVTGQCDATATVPATTDNCAGSIRGTTSDPLTYAAQGTHVITWTFDDGNGNVITANQNVIVNDTTDPNTPTLADVIVQCETSVVIATTTDNCLGTINGTTSDPLTYSAQGTYMIAWSFDDGNGNAIITNQNVIVNDTTDPNTPTLADVIVQCETSVDIATTTDNCLGTINGTTSDPLTYAAQGTYMIAWSFDDGNGNVITANQNVIVNDTIAPIAVAQDITVTLHEFGGATITANDIDNGSSDNCTYTPSIDVTTFDCTNIGIQNTVTLTVTDAAGNTDITTANVTILEHFKETLDLRSLSSFEAFTGTGAITNSGTFTGDVGTNVGALTGFTSSLFNGSVHFNNGLTAQAEIDLLKVYIHLNNISVTHPSANNAAHAPAFGSGETLYPGVYDIGGAGSVAGTLTLNGQGDPNAVFIMKFKGAFTAGAGSNINLINGADAANVFWIAQGALSVGANSAIKGTLLAYPGAITLGVNSSIEGRLLSSVGAITVGVGGTATMPGAMNIPINPMVSYTPAAAVDVLGSVENFSLFTSNGAVANASTSGILGDVGADVGAISGFATSAHIGSFYNADAVTAQAKIDLDNAYNQLMLIPTTVSNHTPAFGSGETLSPGVYSTPGAGSLAGTITLDGGGYPDAVFIFEFNGAFAAGAQSKVILSNGTRRCNVFWISEGAASIGSFSTLKGTILAHNGAATMGAGGNLEGRLLSTGGAIGFSTGVVYTVVHDVECVNQGSIISMKSEPIETPIELDATTLMAYPNPFSTNTTVSFTIPYEEANANLVLYDFRGALIKVLYNDKSNANQKNEVQFNRENLAAGVYLFRLTTSKEAKNFKVIVE